MAFRRVETRSEMLSMAYSDNVWYHGTNPHNLESIMSRGLLPAGGHQHPDVEHGVNIGDGVYVSKSPRYSKNWRGGIVFEITNIDRSKLIPDPWYVWEAISIFGDKRKLPREVVKFKKLIEHQHRTYRGFGPDSGRNILSQFTPEEQKRLIDYADSVGLDTFIFIGKVPAKNLRLMSDKELEDVQTVSPLHNLGYDLDRFEEMKRKKEERQKRKDEREWALMQQQIKEEEDRARALQEAQYNQQLQQYMYDLEQHEYERQMKNAPQG